MTAAFVLIQVSVSGAADASRIHDQLHAISGVKTVHFVAGPTDAIVFVEAAAGMEFLRAVGEIRSTPGVVSSDTRIVLPFTFEQGDPASEMAKGQPLPWIGW